MYEITFFSILLKFSGLPQHGISIRNCGIMPCLSHFSQESPRVSYQQRHHIVSKGGIKRWGEKFLSSCLRTLVSLRCLKFWFHLGQYPYTGLVVFTTQPKNIKGQPADRIHCSARKNFNCISFSFCYDLMFSK